MPPTLQAEIERRNQSPREKALALAVANAKADVEKYRGWFDKVCPSHIDADQFVELCLSVIRRGKVELHMALMQDPGSFFTAVSECARLGLVPGDNYYFVPFKEKKTNTYHVVGMRGYKGEMDLIYRAGAVSAIHCYLVRENDKFHWEPGTELPRHVIPGNDYGQVGLGGVSNRGVLTGVWTFGVMNSGAHSEPVVMGYEEVMKYRAKAKTFEFWGPAWPAEGDWTPDMYRKTAIHRLYPRVPHSAEYRDSMMRSLAAVQSDPIPGTTVPSSVEDSMEDAVEAPEVAPELPAAEQAG